MKLARPSSRPSPPTLTLPRSLGREGWGQAGRGSGPLRVRGRRALRLGVLMFLSLSLGLSLALAGCGKRAAPTAPPDEPDTYPRPYPSE
jgi:hypothetical protein